jgi:hypothetical protein
MEHAGQPTGFVQFACQRMTSITAALSADALMGKSQVYISRALTANGRVPAGLRQRLMRGLRALCCSHKPADHYFLLGSFFFNVLD